MKHILYIIYIAIFLFFYGCQKDKTALDTQSTKPESNSVLSEEVSSSPDKESLLAAFDNDLMTYGYNRLSDMVNYSHRSAGTQKGWSRLNEKEWRSGGMPLKITDIKISENESDRFPYKGTVSYVTEFHPGTEQAVYLFGEKTAHWIRREAVTP